MEHLLGLPPDGSAHGPAIDNLIGLVHWLMFALFLGWGIYYVSTLIRFRKGRHPKASYTGVKSHVSTYLEGGVLIFEVLLLVGFSIPLWSKRVDAFPEEKDATVVRVVAEQFAWNVHYAGRDGKFGRASLKLIDSENPLGLDRSDPDAKDDITTINQLYVPVNKPVLIYLSSKDVIHSFNLPLFRVKQDVIPGMSIPLWFTPTKTTEQIREEMRSQFSVEAALARIRKVVLPQASKVPVSANPEGSILMENVPDSTGATLVAQGEVLTGDDLSTLRGAGVREIEVRPQAKLDKFVSLDDVKDSSGSSIVAKHDVLGEDAVTKLVLANVREINARLLSNLDNFVAMENYNDPSGTAIVAKGGQMTEEILTNLGNAGIKSVSIGPATPTEIACAQLCGLGHFRMRGYITVQTPEEFKQWYDQQEAALQPDTTTQQTSGEAPDSASGRTPQ